VVFGIYLVWAIVDPSHIPSGLTPLLGIAGGVWFGAITDDKRRKDRDVEETADRAETKVERLTDVAEAQHPGTTSDVRTGVERPKNGRHEAVHDD
jgi:hypothetical protein